MTLSQCLKLNPSIEGTCPDDREDEPANAQDWLTDSVDPQTSPVVGALTKGIETISKAEEGSKGDDTHV